MNILGILASDNYIIVNKELIKTIGLEESIIIGDLASMHIYLQRNKQLTDDGYFYYTVDSMQENTSLSDYQQRKAIQNLKKLNLVDVVLRELPAKRFIKLNIENLELLFTSSQKNKELDVKKIEINNNISKDILNNNKNLSKERKTLSSSLSSKKSFLNNEVEVKPKKQKLDKTRFIIDSLKKHVFSKVINIEICELLGKWIEELYAKNKGINSAALDVALEQLESIDIKEQPKIIKKAILNGWRDFEYVIKNQKQPQNNIIVDKDRQVENEQERKHRLQQLQKQKDDSASIKGVDIF